MIQPLRAYQLGARSVCLCTLIALSWLPGVFAPLLAAQRVYTGQAVRRDGAREPSTSPNPCEPPATAAVLRRPIPCPTVGRPSTWARGVRTGSTAHEAGVFGLTGKGRDVGGTTDQFHFAYQTATGDVDVIARLIRVDGKRQRMTAGLMIRASLAAGAADAFLYVSGRQDLGFRHRPSSGAQTSDAAGISELVPVWLKLELRGSVVSAYSSTDGQAWLFVRSEVVTLPSTFVAGLALTSGQTNSQAIGLFDHVEIRQVPSVPGSGTPSAPSAGVPVIAEGPAPGAAAALGATDPGDAPAVRRAPCSRASPRARSLPDSPGGSPAPSRRLRPAPPTPAPPNPVPGHPRLRHRSRRTPITLVFGPSSDHGSNVDRYVFEVLTRGTRRFRCWSGASASRSSSTARSPSTSAACCRRCHPAPMSVV